MLSSLLSCSYFCSAVDVNGDGYVTSKELQSGIQTMIKDWKSLKLSWTGHETVSRAYHISTLVLYILIGIIMWMVVFGISYRDVLLPFVSLIALLPLTASTASS